MVQTTERLERHVEIRDAVRQLCSHFPDPYFRKIDQERGYPEAFIAALTEAGWLSVMIPQEYGGSGLGLAEASVVMEEINRCGGNAGACHGQMYNMSTYCVTVRSCRSSCTCRRTRAVNGACSP